MGIGLLLPLGDGASFGTQPRFADVVDMALAAEAAGLDAVWLPDHFIFQRDPQQPPLGIWEAWTTLAALAVRVPRITVGSLVTCLGWRNPGIVAKMAENLDEISDGRFVLGVGAGWHRPEYEMFHLPWDHRVGRFEDAISLISPLLRTGRVDYQGTFFSASGALNLPGGPRRDQAGPPILIGSNGPRMMRLTAQFADAWNSDWYPDPSGLAPQLVALEEACREVGRDPLTLVKTSRSNVEMPGSTGRRPNPMTGPPERIAEQIAAFKNIGLRHWVAGLDPCNPATITAFGKVIELLDHT